MLILDPALMLNKINVIFLTHFLESAGSFRIQNKRWVDLKYFETNSDSYPFESFVVF